MDRWAILSYIRSQQQAKDPTVDPEGGKVMVVMAVDTASADHGSQLYEARGCVACHTIDGSRLVGPQLQGNLREDRADERGRRRGGLQVHPRVDQAALAKVVNGYPPAMPQLPLTDLEVDSLELYIESLK